MKILIQVFLLVVVSISCTDLVEVDPPRTDLIRATVFKDDATANAAMTDIYYQLSNSGFASGDITSITYLAAMSADEVINGLSYNIPYQQFNDNALQPANSVLLGLWTQLYQIIFKANAIIEGVSGSSSISEDVKAHLIAESKFIRAFCYFYLVNSFGGVPKVIITDYKTNQNIARSSVDEIYLLIEEDLKAAQAGLKEDYSASEGERVRANRFAATAMLARVYLYRENWAGAEAQASLVIDKTDQYGLNDVNEIFLKNSEETIWQLLPVDGNAWDIEIWLGYGIQMQQQLMDSFEDDDLRFSSWTIFGSPYKYQSFDYKFIEYSVVLRLAEQYLIRAEARAHLDNVQGSKTDINIIRARAGLPDTPADDKASLLDAIAQERKIEFFTEWGHRWFDLKRTGTVGMLSTLKANWKDGAKLYPIPAAQLINDLAMTGDQNPGY